MKDFSKTNYSSARAALIEAWRFFNGRRSWIINYWAKPVFELWLEESVNRGLIEAPNFTKRKQLGADVNGLVRGVAGLTRLRKPKPHKFAWNPVYQP